MWVRGAGAFAAALPTFGANGKMEEDVESRDEDGVDERGFSRWDGWVGSLGAVGTSSLFGLVRGVGTFAPVPPTFVLVSRIHLM